MFIGHFGAGLAAKKIDKAPSLGTLFMASQFIDLLWPFMLIFGIEKVAVEPGNSITPLSFIYYPFTHSLLGVVIWGALFGAVYYILKKNFKTSLLLGALVVSHWFLDLIVHIPDLPIFPWESVKVGLGLWKSLAGTLIVEGAIFAAGVYLYVTSTKPKQRRKGTKSFWGLILFLSVIYIMNLFGPPPENVDSIGYVGLAQWLIIAWGYWIDKNRTAIEPALT
ncbi:MAG TPA: metal-dependent hydrolase [Ignavibacteriales bacterium]|nr:metal-dependent hydrolase [Ignavibacteriales bacterium]